MIVRTRKEPSWVVVRKSCRLESMTVPRVDFEAIKGISMLVFDLVLTLDGSVFFTSSLSSRRYKTNISNILVYVRPAPTVRIIERCGPVASGS